MRQAYDYWQDQPGLCVTTVLGKGALSSEPLHEPVRNECVLRIEPTIDESSPRSELTFGAGGAATTRHTSRPNTTTIRQRINRCSMTTLSHHYPWGSNAHNAIEVVPKRDSQQGMDECSNKTPRVQDEHNVRICVNSAQLQSCTKGLQHPQGARWHTSGGN